MVERINWYPGHMKKTRELIQKNLKMVDAVIEVVDARIPISSRNPIIDELIISKPRVIVLNKSDLADETANSKWAETLRQSPQTRVVVMNSVTGAGVKELFRDLEQMQADRDREKDEHRAEQGLEGESLRKAFRLMIAGVPNVGKSSLINRMTGSKSAKTGDKPGVTKGKQWLKVQNGMQLLDTPGILWPKFEDPRAGINLAFCGSIKDEILDVPTLGMELIGVLTRHYPDMLMKRYKIDELYSEGDVSPETGYPIESERDKALANMHLLAKKRGCIMGGGRIDYERMGRQILDEFRGGKIGRITLEFPEKQ
ncbi:MAG: ribosome biogenesis GTPase YlqF [Lentihominibacter sp.]